ncbi:MAG: hypothetical protein ACLUEQ_06630 [Cloacibacillus evryensis]
MVSQYVERQPDAQAVDANGSRQRHRPFSSSLRKSPQTAPSNMDDMVKPESKHRSETIRLDNIRQAQLFRPNRAVKHTAYSDGNKTEPKPDDRRRDGAESGKDDIYGDKRETATKTRGRVFLYIFLYSHIYAIHIRIHRIYPAFCRRFPD